MTDWKVRWRSHSGDMREKVCTSEPQARKLAEELKAVHVDAVVSTTEDKVADSKPLAEPKVVLKPEQEKRLKVEAADIEKRKEKSRARIADMKEKAAAKAAAIEAEKQKKVTDKAAEVEVREADVLGRFGVSAAVQTDNRVVQIVGTMTGAKNTPDGMECTVTGHDGSIHTIVFTRRHYAPFKRLHVPRADFKTAVKEGTDLMALVNGRNKPLLWRSIPREGEKGIYDHVLVSSNKWRPVTIRTVMEHLKEALPSEVTMRITESDGVHSGRAIAVLSPLKSVAPELYINAGDMDCETGIHLTLYGRIGDLSLTFDVRQCLHDKLDLTKTGLTFFGREIHSKAAMKDVAEEVKQAVASAAVLEGLMECASKIQLSTEERQLIQTYYDGIGVISSSIAAEIVRTDTSETLYEYALTWAKLPVKTDGVKLKLSAVAGELLVCSKVWSDYISVIKDAVRATEIPEPSAKEA